jgi:D-alanyl-lipoteichoic acid acyltransferase DltB (MBOAT superfamily)
LNFLPDIFLYNQDAPLLFTRLYFWGFLLVCLAVYSIVYRQRGLRNSYLFLISLFFYYKTSGLFFLLLVFSTTSDYLIGLAIYSLRSRPWKKAMVALSVTINLGLLSYFKYAYFFTDTFNQVFNTRLEVVNYLALWTNQVTGSHFDASVIFLPVGISFFTFQTISYAVDVYRGKCQPVRNIMDFGFYVSFFPQLVAGPIVRASEFVPQLYSRWSLTREEFGFALWMIMKGLFKKMVLGDYLAVNFIDRVFETPALYTGFENLMALYGYSLQVYCDFSGYTDIAIGVALLLGFRLPKNFNSPYKAENLGDFWRRWHMSLSSWLRDYLYIPIGGNRKGRLRTNINLMVTMLLGGLWHGADMKFIIWGGLNGIGLIVYKFWKKISPWEHRRNIFVHAWKIFLTFNFITFTRIWFRADDMDRVDAMLFQLRHSMDLSIVPDVVGSYSLVLGIMLFGYLTHWWPSRWKDSYMNWFIRIPHWTKGILIVILVFMIYQSQTSDLQPFIYFQF